MRRPAAARRDSRLPAEGIRARIGSGPASPGLSNGILQTGPGSPTNSGAFAIEENPLVSFP
jgi:hypothetical protein